MQLNREKLRRQLNRYVPITAWLPTYPRDLLRGDIISGVTVWGVMVPVVMADIGENRIYQSVPAAVHDFEQRNR